MLCRVWLQLVEPISHNLHGAGLWASPSRKWPALGQRSAARLFCTGWQELPAVECQKLSSVECLSHRFRGAPEPQIPLNVAVIVMVSE